MALAPEMPVVAGKRGHDGSVVAALQRPTRCLDVAHPAMLHCQIDADGCNLAVTFNLAPVAGHTSGIVPWGAIRGGTTGP